MTDRYEHRIGNVDCPVMDMSAPTHAEKLNSIANWFDWFDKSNNVEGDEVQQYLRELAVEIKNLQQKQNRENPNRTCARYCESTAFLIKIKNLESENRRAMSRINRDCGSCKFVEESIDIEPCLSCLNVEPPEERFPNWELK